MWPEDPWTFVELCQAHDVFGQSSRTLVTPPAMLFLFFWPLCGKMRGPCEGRAYEMGRGRKTAYPLPIALLTFAFSVSDHRLSGINILRAKSTSTQPQFWQTELSLCGLVCLWPSLPSGQVVTSLSPWNLWARLLKLLPSLSIAKKSKRYLFKTRNPWTLEKCVEIELPIPVHVPENDSLGHWPEEGFSLNPEEPSVSRIPSLAWTFNCESRGLDHTLGRL